MTRDVLWEIAPGGLAIALVFLTCALAYRVGRLDERHATPIACEPVQVDTVVVRTRWPKGPVVASWIPEPTYTP